MKNPLLRPVRPEDEDAVRSLVARTVIETYGAFCSQVVQTARRDPAALVSARLTFTGGWLAASPGSGTVLGVVLTKDDVLRELFVAPEAQGQGIGRVLLAMAEQEIFSRAFATARLDVAEPNARARRFYTAHGWRETTGRILHSRWGFAMIEMRKARSQQGKVLLV